MKLFDRSTEVESIEINYMNGKRYSIWLPKEVHLSLKLEMDEDENGNHTQNDLNCEVNIHCSALWDNINTIED